MLRNPVVGNLNVFGPEIVWQNHAEDAMKLDQVFDLFMDSDVCCHWDQAAAAIRRGLVFWVYV